MVYIIILREQFLTFAQTYIIIYAQTKIGGDEGSPRTGRPTDDPKSNWTGFRLSNKDIEKLDYCVKETGKSKAEIVRQGIDLVYEKVRNK